RARRYGLDTGCPDRWIIRGRGGKLVRSVPRRVARPSRHLCNIHSRSALAPKWSVWRSRMRDLAAIVIAMVILGAIPLFTSSNVVLNFLVVTLLIALVGQGWNLLGGYGGQYSFGHAAFFGTGAYVTAVLQVRYGVNAWLGFAIGIVAGAGVGAIT